MFTLQALLGHSTLDMVMTDTLWFKGGHLLRAPNADSFVTLEHPRSNLAGPLFPAQVADQCLPISEHD